MTTYKMILKIFENDIRMYEEREIPHTIRNRYEYKHNKRLLEFLERRDEIILMYNLIMIGEQPCEEFTLTQGQCKPFRIDEVEE